MRCGKSNTHLNDLLVALLDRLNGDGGSGQLLLGLLHPLELLVQETRLLQGVSTAYLSSYDGVPRRVAGEYIVACG